jgi:sec-independent protein translocase protein TatC
MTDESSADSDGSEQAGDEPAGSTGDTSVTDSGHATADDTDASEAPGESADSDAAAPSASTELTVEEAAAAVLRDREAMSGGDDGSGPGHPDEDPAFGMHGHPGPDGEGGDDPRYQGGETDPRDLPPGHPGRGGMSARRRAEEAAHAPSGGPDPYADDTASAATEEDESASPEDTGTGDVLPGPDEPDSSAGADGFAKADRHGTGAADPVAEPVGPAPTGDPVDPADEGLLDAPPDDEERPLEEHVEEMVRRLAIVIGVFVVGTALAFPLSEGLIDFLWRGFLPAGERPHVYGPLELLFTKFLVAGLAGLVLALPAFVYQTYRFMRPGLYPHERRYYLASVPTSLVLAGLGIAFAYFLVLPAIFAYFTTYTQEAASIAFGLRETFNLIVMLMAALAFVFQIPLFVMLAIMMGVTDRRWLEDRRLYFWGGFLGIAFIFTPDPTGMAPVLVAATMVGLFEGTLLLLRWTDSGAFSPASLASRRPYIWGLAVVVGYAVGPSPVPTGYRGSIPDSVLGALDAVGVLVALPALIALLVAGLYELLTLAVQRARALRVQLALLRARPVVWIVAGLLGYAATPDPLPLRLAAEIALPIPWAVGVTAVLIAAFELGLHGLRRRRDDAASWT